MLIWNLRRLRNALTKVCDVLSKFLNRREALLLYVDVHEVGSKLLEYGVEILGSCTCGRDILKSASRIAMLVEKAEERY